MRCAEAYTVKRHQVTRADGAVAITGRPQRSGPLHATEKRAKCPCKVGKASSIPTLRLAPGVFPCGDPAFFETDPVEYKQADRGRQVSSLTRFFDLCDHLRHRQTLALRDFLQGGPKRIFESDLGLASINVDGPLDDWRIASSSNWPLSSLSRPALFL